MSAQNVLEEKEKNEEDKEKNEGDRDKDNVCGGEKEEEEEKKKKIRMDEMKAEKGEIT